MTTFITKQAHEKGLKIVDAKRPMLLSVGPGDVTLASRKNSKCCAFARAAVRQLPINAAYFLLSSAYLEYDDKIVRYRLPPSVQKEIVSFDRGAGIAAGRYQLTAPSETMTLKHLKKARKADKRKRHDKGAKAGTERSRGKILVTIKAPTTVKHRTENVRSQMDPTP